MEPEHLELQEDAETAELNLALQNAQGTPTLLHSVTLHQGHATASQDLSTDVELIMMEKPLNVEISTLQDAEEDAQQLDLQSNLANASSAQSENVGLKETQNPETAETDTWKNALKDVLLQDSSEHVMELRSHQRCLFHQQRNSQ